MLHEAELIKKFDQQIDFFSGCISLNPVVDWNESNENNIKLSILPINGSGVINRLSYYCPELDVKNLCTGELIDIHYFPNVKYTSKTKDVEKKLMWHADIIKYSAVVNYFQTKKLLNKARIEFKMFATSKDVEKTVRYYLNKICNDSNIVEKVMSKINIDKGIFERCSYIDNIVDVWVLFGYNPCALYATVGYQEDFETYLDKSSEKMGKVYRPMKIGIYGTQPCKPYNRVMSYDGQFCFYLPQEDKDKLNIMFSHNGRNTKKFLTDELSDLFPKKSIETLYESLRTFKKTHKNFTKIFDEEYESLKESLRRTFYNIKTYFIDDQSEYIDSYVEPTKNVPEVAEHKENKVVKVEEEKTLEVSQDVKKDVDNEIPIVLNTPVKNRNLQSAIDKCNAWLAVS